MIEIAKASLPFYQTQNKLSKVCLRFLKVCPSGTILPNLVTLHNPPFRRDLCNVMPSQRDIRSVAQWNFFFAETYATTLNNFTRVKSILSTAENHSKTTTCYVDYNVIEDLLISIWCINWGYKWNETMCVPNQFIA